MEKEYIYIYTYICMTKSLCCTSDMQHYELYFNQNRKNQKGQGKKPLIDVSQKKV